MRRRTTPDGSPRERLKRRSCHFLAARPLASIGPCRERADLYCKVKSGGIDGGSQKFCGVPMVPNPSHSSGESIANLTPSIRLRLQEMEFAAAVGPFSDPGG